MSAIVGQMFHFEFSHARIKIPVHIGSVGVMISKLVINQVFLVWVVAVLDERDNFIVQRDICFVPISCGCILGRSIVTVIVLGGHGWQ